MRRVQGEYIVAFPHGRAFRQLLIEAQLIRPDVAWSEYRGLLRTTFRVNASEPVHQAMNEEFAEYLSRPRRA